MTDPLYHRCCSCLCNLTELHCQHSYLLPCCQADGWIILRMDGAFFFFSFAFFFLFCFFFLLMSSAALMPSLFTLCRSLNSWQYRPPVFHFSRFTLPPTFLLLLLCFFFNAPETLPCFYNSLSRFYSSLLPRWYLQQLLLFSSLQFHFSVFTSFRLLHFSESFSKHTSGVALWRCMPIGSSVVLLRCPFIVLIHVETFPRLYN